MIALLKKAAFLIVLFFPFLTHATDRFVQTGGTDSGDCNGAPCQTLTYALTQSVAADDIYIDAGTYIESPTISIAVNLLENTAPVLIAGNVTLDANITNVGPVEASVVTVTNSGVIQDALNLIQAGSAIDINAGTYSESVNVTKNIGFSGGNITVNDITVNSVTLDFDTEITVVNGVTLIDGIINVVSLGHLYFGTSAVDPFVQEDATAYITGTATMQTRTVGPGSISFLGANVSTGTSIGDVSISRTTGTNGIATGTVSNSIACTWTISSTVDPSDRTIDFSWYDYWDNVVSTSDQSIWQDDGGGWSILDNPAESSASPRNLTSGANPTKFGDFTIAAQNAALPVDLTYFKATSQLDHTLLQWQTASEINHDYFEIQRSEHGEEFEALDRIPSHHNSTTTHNYEWKDFVPLSGMSYYRLKMVDFDGYTEYSPIVSASASNQSLALHPNPTSNVLNIESDLEAGSVAVFNASGKRINLAIENQQIDVSSLLPGIYMLRMISNSQVIQARFIKE